MQSYDYAHRQGVEEITWPRFEVLARRLAEQVAAFDIQAVVGVARAGLFPATFLAAALRKALYPLALSRRVDDIVQFKQPLWRVDLSPDVRGRRVLIVDEIADTGETLKLVAERARQAGAAQVFTATLVAHSWANPQPDACPLVTDALVLFPWDRQVYQDGRWQDHPELVEALRLQQKDPQEES